VTSKFLNARRAPFRKKKNAQVEGLVWSDLIVEVIDCIVWALGKGVFSVE
jgi:hypothetical protein